LIEHLGPALAKAHGPHVGGFDLTDEHKIEQPQKERDHQQLAQQRAKKIIVVHHRAWDIVRQKELFEILGRKHIDAETLLGRALFGAAQVGDPVRLAHHRDLFDQPFLGHPAELKLIERFELAFGFVINHAQHEEQQHAHHQPRTEHPLGRHGAGGIAALFFRLRRQNRGRLGHLAFILGFIRHSSVSYVLTHQSGNAKILPV